jgi:isopenicillin N synthase-like dioxygenase
LALGLDEDYFEKNFTHPMAALRLLHYNQRLSEIDKGVFACGAHSDYGMITLLATDDVPGL